MGAETGVRVRRLPPNGLGDLLRLARRRAGLGVRHAARTAGITHSYLLALEAGARTPSRTVADALSEVLALEESERAVLLDCALTDAGRDHPNRRLRRLPRAAE